MRFSSHSPEDTQKLGERIGQLLQTGDIVLLSGDLGAGKTTLIQGIASGLKVQSNEYVRSPSFTLINEYKGRLPIYHIDLYRLDSIAEMEELGLEDYLFGQGVSLIEWGEKLFPDSSMDRPCALPITKRVDIRLEIDAGSDRWISVSPLPADPASHPLFALQ
ncbi:tRNA (adenosine(37)-N6)-threonylcarbamoyltransferase complex ATPase subunit type 1 TsaE [Nitrospina watsonii]|uniref:tRNA threonylcarbamoyladenosine biosynthesis protein TsaE n=1 Tax=Nitrospina watsonii TaxID=1323948 RepID=A0ABN8W1P5_9BACT|nr:tRNA (adenosine(37)-N6)-threonylcarbamoyltransferase complex ATPase subunit type 1 TsaE [Nitrospina watsonii]CAI2718470.1 t(6)A37 threonylcarbamoyladenosine biosynthesis protein TsaE [Nitrospina watsonii]